MPAATGSEFFARPSESARAFLTGSAGQVSALGQNACHVNSEIAEDAVAAGALEGKQRFEHDAFAVDPAIGGGCA